jgi:AraC-like DNA-binding protein
LDIRARLRSSDAVVRARRILSRDGVTLDDVACRHRAGRGRVEAAKEIYAIVFVRRGCFVRSADGAEAVLDPTIAYCRNPEVEERFDHPHAHGDDCTALLFEPGLVASMWGGEAALPAGPVPTSPEIDLEHRLLLGAAHGDADPHDLVERALGLAARLLEQADPRRVASGRPATARARRALSDGAREALAADPDRSLQDLARDLAVSPHHLSRVFSAANGSTISRHRMRLRARIAMERLAAGDHDLARLAADLGFADQSHLCRVVRTETGSTPAALRAALA